MKYVLFIALFISSSFVYANDPKNEWNATLLTETTIKNIQQAQYQYKKCATDNMQKMGSSTIEVRSSTETIIKQCENVLAKMRQVYIDANVPTVIADRHLKKMRIEITRRVLKQLMFVQAARKAGQ